MTTAKTASSSKLPPKPKPAKLPKSLGLCVDKLHDAREARLEIEKLAKEYKAEETRIHDHIIDNLSKSEDGGAVGKRFKAIVKKEAKPRIADDKKFYAFIKKNDAFDMLNRAINVAAWRERMDDPKFKNKGVPGVESFTAVKLSVTKV